MPSRRQGWLAVASIISHPAVPLVLGLGLGTHRIPRRLLLAGVLASIAPDADVVAFRLGVPFDAPLAHRGFTHALAFAGLCAIVAAAASRWLRAGAWTAAAFVAASMASHGLLDALTNGGRGVMFFWPFDQGRYFWPFRPIEVSPIGVRGFFSAQGAAVLGSELVWIWLPAATLGAALLLARRAAQGGSWPRS